MTVASPQLRFWIDMAGECVRRDHTDKIISPGDQRGPFLTARALGMALAVLHDANAIAVGRAPLVNLPVPAGLAGSHPIVAAAAACHEVLLRRYPGQQRFLAPAWANWTELYPTVGTQVAEAAGRALGQSMHQFGANDGALGADMTYNDGPANYRHRRPPNQPTQDYAGAVWGQAPELVVPRPPFAQPPGRVSATTVKPTDHYKADFAKVALKGIEHRKPGVAGHRTLEEEIIGIFWGYDGPQDLGTPPRLYLQVVLEVLDAIEARMPGKLNVGDELAIIAGVGIAMADAGIHAWHYKYSEDHMMWRPVIGIPNADPKNGKPQPGWLPLGRPDTNGTETALTPDFPAYPSGHATFGAAAFQLLRLVLVEKGLAKFDAEGVDNVGFDFVSDEYDGRNEDPRTRLPRDLITRRHASLWQAIVENSVSRVYLGVHWEFDGVTVKGPDGKAAFGVPVTPKELGDIGGVWLGAQIANVLALKLGVSPTTINKSCM